MSRIILRVVPKTKQLTQDEERFLEEGSFQLPCPTEELVTPQKWGMGTTVVYGYDGRPTALTLPIRSAGEFRRRALFLPLPPERYLIGVDNEGATILVELKV